MLLKTEMSVSPTLSGWRNVNKLSALDVKEQAI